jgi:2-oxoglutarate ferredoxin oxidoreductase subunit delta
MTPKNTTTKLNTGQGMEPQPVSQDHQPLEQSRDPKKQFDIDIFRAWCKACGICVAFCPKHCLRLDDEGAPAISDADQCSGCGFCELHCPDFAISVHPRRERPIIPETAD